MLRFLLVVTLALSSAACDGSDPLGCANNKQCPSGHVCDRGLCAQVCENSNECPPGYTCDDSGLCQQGVGGTQPEITSVMGNGTQSCPDANGGYCFSSGIIVRGRNLGVASFSLRNRADSSIYDLQVDTGATDTQVTALLPSELPDTCEGQYFLVAQNTAGTDEFGVDVLKGEPCGMSGEELLVTINTDATGRFIPARLPQANDLINIINQGSVNLSVDIIPGSGSTLSGDDVVNLINTDTTMTINAARLPSFPDSGEAVVALLNDGAGSSRINASRLPPSGSGGQLHMQRTAATAGTAVAIDDATLTSLCQDEDGCTMMLGYRYWEWDGTDATAVRAIVWGPPCRFHMDNQRWWGISQWCIQEYQTGGGPSQPVNSDSYGQEGADDEEDPVLDESYIPLIYFAGGQAVCYVGETPCTAEPCGFMDNLLTDGFTGHGTYGNDAGLYFWMSTNAPAAFSNPNRTCELLIED